MPLWKEKDVAAYIGYWYSKSENAFDGSTKQIWRQQVGHTKKKMKIYNMINVLHEILGGGDTHDGRKVAIKVEDENKASSKIWVNGLVNMFEEKMVLNEVVKQAHGISAERLGKSVRDSKHWKKMGMDDIIYTS